MINDSFKCLRLRDIHTGLSAKDKYEAIRMAGNYLVERGCVEPDYIDAMFAREEEITTYIGAGVAIPHGIGAARKFIKKTGIVILQFPDGVPFEEGRAYLVIGIAGIGDEHLSILQVVADVMTNEERAKKLRASTNPLYIYKQFIL